MTRRHRMSFVTAAALILSASHVANGQNTPAGRAAPRLHGIFQPVSYAQDVELNDVFFVTVDNGWVTGGSGSHSGVLLHTIDGGSTWTVALGDAAGAERPFYNLRFIDRSIGFVAQGTAGGDHKLLRTIDGSTWRVSGTVPQHHQDYRFVSATIGVAATGNSIVRTTDAGRTWTKAFDCRVMLQVQGVNVNTSCEVSSFSFVSATVGYAIAGSLDTKGLYVFATQDGGATWTTAIAQPGPNDGREAHVAFTTDKSGYACLKNNTLLGTTDGGVTWEEAAGVSCHNAGPVVFADPEVAWSLQYDQLTWTADGGRTWKKQQIRTPYAARAFSLPRRDRAYVVGDHGMIFRYVIVPVEVGANAVAGPLMPGFSTAIEDRAMQLDSAVTSIATTLAALPPDSTAAAGGTNVAAAGSTPTTSSATSSDALAPFLDKCCGKRLGTLDLVFNAVVGLVPDYTQKYKNLNLVTLGLRIAGALPASTDSLKGAIQAFRSAKDRPSADQALANIRTALAALRAAADTAVQKTTP